MSLSKIRVLNIQETIRSGGVERRRLSLSKLLDKSLFELKVVCTHRSSSIADEIEANGVEVIEVGNLDSPFQWSQHKKVQKIIDSFKPHIIHGAVFEGVTMAAINGFFKRVPIVILEETSDPKNRTWKGTLLMKLYSFVADKVIGVSPASTQYLTDVVKINSQKVQLVMNGVAPRKDYSIEQIHKLKEDLHIKNDTIVIGSTGRMIDDNTKRFSDLIKAFKKIKANYSEVKLVLVGEGRLIEEYKKLAQSLEIQDDVIFTGYQKEVDLYYSLFDIFTLVSANESFGLVLAEAMLKKLPIVATKVGGMQFIVKDNETGFLVEPKNITQIAEKLEVLVKDIPLRKAMGEKGYQRALEHFTEERYVKNVEELYKTLLQKKKLL